MVPRQVDFKVPKIECNGAEEIPYQDMEEVELEQMVTKMVCEVKHVTACNPVVSTKCANINYQECAELPEETCEEIEMQLPRQVSTSTFLGRHSLMAGLRIPIQFFGKKGHYSQFLSH